MPPVGRPLWVEFEAADGPAHCARACGPAVLSGGDMGVRFTPATCATLAYQWQVRRSRGKSMVLLLSHQGVEGRCRYPCAGASTSHAADTVGAEKNGPAARRRQPC